MGASSSAVSRQTLGVGAAAAHSQGRTGLGGRVATWGGKQLWVGRGEGLHLRGLTCPLLSQCYLQTQGTAGHCRQRALLFRPE